MKRTTTYTAQVLNPPLGGKGAKKYIAPRIEWIPLDNEISLALQSTPPAGPSETMNLQHSPFKPEISLV